MQNLNKLGFILESERARLQMTWREMAAHLRVSPTTLHRICTTEQTARLQMSTKKNIATFLGYRDWTALLVSMVD